MTNRDKILITVVALMSIAILASQAHRGDFGVLAATSSAEGAFDRTLTVNGPVQLSLENGAGGVTITRGATDKVEIHAKIRAHGWFGGGDPEAVRQLEQKPPVEQTGNNIRIFKPEPQGEFRNIAITYDITAPEQTSVESHTGSGAQRIEGLKGPVKARSGSGSVTINNIGSQIEARAGSGHITLNNINGRADLETGSGGVDANDIAGGVKVHTGSGGIDVKQSAPGDVEAEAGSGHIRLSGLEGAVHARCGSGGITVDGIPKDSWQFHSGSGSIEVRTLGNVGLDLRAHTSSGRVNVEGPITIESGELNKRDVSGKIRGGGVTLEASTGSGSIYIR